MTLTPTQTSASLSHKITWEKLPDNFLLPDEPVENLIHPLITNALNEPLGIAGFISGYRLIASNYGICATVNGKTIVKAPDWVYVPYVFPIAMPQINRSYTPNLEGEVPAVVIEILSDNDGSEYSVNPRYPYGKWYFYEQILQVPIYIIFDPDIGSLEVRELVSGKYQLQLPNANGQYWIASMELFLGIWQGTRLNYTGLWLRWWDAQGNLLPWANERLMSAEQQAQEAQQQAQEAQQQAQEAQQQAQEAQQQAQEAQQQAQEAQHRAELLAQKLKELGIDPENLQ